MALKMTRQLPVLAIYIRIKKTDQIQQLKGMRFFLVGMWKRNHLSLEGVGKGSFLVVNGLKKVTGLDLVAEPPHANKTLLSTTFPRTTS